VEAVRRIKAVQELKDIPIIMVTAKVETEDLEVAFAAGAMDYITKPVDEVILLARVRSALHLKKEIDLHKLAEDSLRQTNLKLSVSLSKLKSDTKAAAAIQRSMLPKQDNFSALHGVNLVWNFKPCDDVGGDTLNAFSLDDEHIGFFSLDVSGHGVQAAMLAVPLNLRLMERTAGGNLLVDTDGRARDPASVVMSLNNMFQTDLDLVQYFTMTYGVYHKQSRLLRFTQAGHPPMVISSPTGDVYVHEDGDLPVGLLPNAEYRTHERVVEARTRLFLYSDGIYEVGLDKPFESEDLVALVKEGRQSDLKTNAQYIVDVVEAYMKEKSLDDDVSLLVLELG